MGVRVWCGCVVGVRVWCVRVCCGCEGVVWCGVRVWCGCEGVVWV